MTFGLGFTRASGSNSSGSQERPRLAVFRSLKHIYAQVIDDKQGKTLAAASSGEKNSSVGSGGNLAGAKEVGKLIAERAKTKGISKVVFDRGGYLYHGRSESPGRCRARSRIGVLTMAATPTAKRIDANTLNLKEHVVSINRVTKVVKGGKNLSFSALVVIGDPGAKIVGFGTGKAKEVPAAIKKGIEAAKKNLRKVNVLETTILHMVLGRFGSGLVLLKPAPEGTGVIAGGPVRAVIQAVGITERAHEIHWLAQSA